MVFTSDKRQKQMTVYLCPGAKVTLAKPHAVRHVRINVDLNNIALQDLVNSEGGGQFTTQISLIH